MQTLLKPLSCLQEANTAGASPGNYAPPPDVGAALKKGVNKLDLPDPLKTVLPGKVMMLGSQCWKGHANGILQAACVPDASGVLAPWGNRRRAAAHPRTTRGLSVCSNDTIVGNVLVSFLPQRNLEQ